LVTRGAGEPQEWIIWLNKKKKKVVGRCLKWSLKRGVKISAHLVRNLAGWVCLAGSGTSVNPEHKTFFICDPVCSIGFPARWGDECLLQASLPFCC
jgi:hypothetical protein